MSLTCVVLIDMSHILEGCHDTAMSDLCVTSNLPLV
jgi:hypothetical protein